MNAPSETPCVKTKRRKQARDHEPELLKQPWDKKDVVIWSQCEYLSALMGGRVSRIQVRQDLLHYHVWNIRETVTGLFPRQCNTKGERNTLPSLHRLTHIHTFTTLGAFTTQRLPSNRAGRCERRWGSWGPIKDSALPTASPSMLREQQPRRVDLFVSTKATTCPWGLPETHTEQGSGWEQRKIWVISKDNLRFTH